ncbi:hypothetical protein F5Y10DRAFT_236973 [Nemania abortiva]|nr:hypothetical protein F5Y10DRAFT_236973 [Nemania abortiva]
MESGYGKLVNILPNIGANIDFLEDFNKLAFAVEIDDARMIGETRDEETLNTGYLNTKGKGMYNRSLDVPARKEVHRSKIVSFNTTASQLPGLALGLNTLDASGNANLRVLAYTKTIDAHRIFSVGIMSWWDGSLDEAGCCWMEVAADDPDYQFGAFNTKDDHSWDRPQPQTVRKLHFKRAYREPPKVVLWLNSLDITHQSGWHVNIYAINISEYGFTMHIDTWDNNSAIFACGATWVAHSAGARGVASGICSTVDSGSVEFGRGVFEKSPQNIFLGISSLDFRYRCKQRIELRSSNVCKDGMRVHIDTGDDDNVGWATASYIIRA